MGAAALVLLRLWSRQCLALPAPGQLCAVPCLHLSCWPELALPSLTPFLLLLLCSSTPNFAALP